MAVESKDKGRLLWLDALKGAGILFVVAGHVWTRGEVRDAIYLFHMPLFFIVAGYMARAEPVSRAARRGLLSLMLPWAVFALLLLGLDFFIEGLRGVRPIFPTWIAGLTGIAWQTEALRGPFTILWFVPCLFLARLLWCAIASRLPRLDDPRWFAVAVALLAVGWEAAQLTGRSPMGMLAVPGACILLWLGSLWHARPPGRELLGAIILIAVLALIFLPPVNMKSGDVGLPVIGLTGAAAVSVALGAGVQSIPSSIQHGLAWLGTRSLVIMYVHVAAIHYAAPYAPKTVLFVFALVAALLIDTLARSTRSLRFLMLGQR
jgi:fucose 4-O-acetylase-like acetyltransferase